MDRNVLYDVAEAYYRRDETMEQIARRIGTSRSTVSRLLSTARAEGIVRITIDTQGRSTSALAESLGRRFSVRAHVVDVPAGVTHLQRLDRVAHRAAALLGEWVEDDTSVGLAWGTTVGAVVDRLTPQPRKGCTVLQLNGAANVQTSGLSYTGELLSKAAEAFGATPQYFPVPAFFDDPRTRDLLFAERSVARVLALQATLDVAVFGVGSPHGSVRSHVYAGGYLTSDDLAVFARERAAGDVCTVFVREDGTFADISLNARASGPTPRDLSRVPRRLCVVADEAKVPALLGAVRCGAVTDLVVDATTARAAVRRDGGDAR